MHINGRDIIDLLYMENEAIRSFLENLTQLQLLQLDDVIDNLIPHMPNDTIKLNIIKNIIEGIVIQRVIRRQYTQFNMKPRRKSRSRGKVRK